VESPIRRIRRNLGLTQRDLAFVCGLASGSLICEVETGARPISGALAELLKRAHFDLDEILREQEAFMSEKKAEVMAMLIAEAKKSS
jgi:Predicted transcriptional regulator with C-terminal CBS domains